jgi:uncharacterized membrane protein YdjX (TVP38/TMEM64 family)
MAKNDSRYRKIFTNRRFWVSVSFLALILYYCFGPSRLFLNREALIVYLRTWGIWSPILFVVIYAVSTIIGAPSVIFTIAGGAVFGLVWGTIYSVLGATLGAVGAFWLSRYLLRGWVERRFAGHPTLQRFEQAIAIHALQFVLIVRFPPITPFNVENFLFGLTSIAWQPYVIGTLIGIIPGTIAYTWLGVTGADTLQGGSYLSFIVAISFFVFLSVSTLLISRWRDRPSPKR